MVFKLFSKGGTAKTTQKASKTIADILPVKDLVGEGTKLHFITRDGVHVDIFHVNTFDLNSLSATDREYMITQWMRFHQAYSDDLKLISMNFPTDTSKQQAYFNHKIANTRNYIAKEFLEEKLEELVNVQKRGVDRYYYLMTFSEDEDKWESDRQIIQARLIDTALCAKETTIEEKLEVLSKLSDKNDPYDGLNGWKCLTEPRSKQEKAVKEKGYNPYLLVDIQPHGNMHFGVEKFMKTGSGYETCITVYRYPQRVGLYWLLQVLTLDRTVAVMDIHTQDQQATKRNLNDAIREQRKRLSTESDLTAKDEAAYRQEQLRAYYEEIEQQGYVSKEITIRIYLYGRTFQELDDFAASRLEKLKSDGYKAAIMVNEAKADWQSQFQSYEQQQKTVYGRIGQTCLSKTIAKGLPFYFTNVDDPSGSYFGTTNSNQGACLFDIFSKTKTRLSYNALMIGTMGSGKSTAMKKLILDNAIRGNYIRIIDPTGEYTTLVERLGGSVISLDGSQGVLNALEVLKTNDESEALCWDNHVSKLATCYSLVNAQTTTGETAEFSIEVRRFYEKWGIIDPNIELNEQNITGLSSTEYPTWSDFARFIHEELDNTSIGQDEVAKEVAKLRISRLDSIAIHIDDLVNSYGRLVDGHTSLNGHLFESPIISFNTASLDKIKASISDLQIFLAIQSCWDNCLTVGSRMKQLYDNNEIAWDDITRFAIVIDEAHRIINTNKRSVVEQILYIQRMARKLFGGVWLASQSIRDFVPEGSSESAADQIRVMFEESPYKLLLRQDNSAAQMISSTFGSILSQEDLDDLVKLEMGHCILCFGSERKVQVAINLTADEQEMFKGGA